MLFLLRLAAAFNKIGASEVACLFLVAKSPITSLERLSGATSNPFCDGLRYLLPFYAPAVNGQPLITAFPSISRP